MATDQQFCLRWNNHQSTLISVFDSLLENGTLVDCTLAAEGQYLKAHKVVLSACSPYFEALLSLHYEKHPIVILKDVKFTELKSMMDYMYRGEVNISQDQLGTFLKAAESLQIKGLSENGDDARDVGSTAPKRQESTPSTRPSVTQVRAPAESKRPAPSGDLSDASRDGSISPLSVRKRRRTRRPSQEDDADLDSSNNCDLPPAQSTPVPNATIVPTPVQSLPKQIVKQEQPSTISRLDTMPMQDAVKKEIIDPPSEPLLEPKTEYLDYMNNENSIEVEDLTLDDDDEELDTSMDASRPGPSHGDMSNQGYPPWPMGDQSGTDEIFMAAQEAVGAATAAQQQRDSQGVCDEDSLSAFECGERFDSMFASAFCMSKVNPSYVYFSELDNSPKLDSEWPVDREGSVRIYNAFEDHSYSTKESVNLEHQSNIFHPLDILSLEVDGNVAPRGPRRRGRPRGSRNKRQRFGITREHFELQAKREGCQTARFKEEVDPENRCHSRDVFRVFHKRKGRPPLYRSQIPVRSSYQPRGSQKEIGPISDFGKITVNKVSEKVKKVGADYQPENLKFKEDLEQRRILGSGEELVSGESINNLVENIRVKEEQKKTNQKQRIKISAVKRGGLSKARYDYKTGIHVPGTFKCDQCPRQYKYLRGLRLHQRYSCGKEPMFQCPACFNKFPYKQNLKSHMFNQHPEMFDEWYCKNYKQ